MTTAPTEGRLPVFRVGGLVVTTALVGVMLAWLYFGMRAVMDIGGACATGGPYVPAVECPQGAAVLISIAPPVLLLSTFAATGLAVTMGAPTLLLPMWFLLFGSLGWNFLEYAFSEDGIVFGWLVPGIMFEAMALPALFLWVGSGVLRRAGGGPEVRAARRWKAAQLAIIAVGVGVGVLTFDAWT